MTGALTDAAWIEICEAARLIPDADARAQMSALLFGEYPAFAYDRKRVLADLRRAKRMLTRLAAFEADYRTRFTGDDIKTEADLWWIGMLRRRPEAMWLACRATRRANPRRKSMQREWLYHRLCGIWLDCFHGRDLTVSVPSTGGAPRGPLIKFMLAAMKQVMPRRALPKPESVRDAIYRERDERENARQLRLELEQRERQRDRP
jgi:hypothetical protein